MDICILLIVAVWIVVDIKRGKDKRDKARETRGGKV
jgi:hypothetical protein